jgi:ABC-type bacteriocin/lantibiotic exporter with double-glycine peptidase domain
MLNDIPPTQQLENYSCSAATLKAVFRHWGKRVDEPTLTRIIGAKPEVGAAAPAIVQAARRYGFAADVRAFKSIDELHDYVGKRRRGVKLPVIANIFSFNRPGQGHFVVVDDINADRVKIMDPNSATNWRELSHQEMKKRWLGRGGIGVIVRPKGQAQPHGLGEVAPKVSVPPPRPSKSIAAVAIAAAAWAGIVGLMYWHRVRHERLHGWR